jgi:hypothetical protein
MAKEVYFAEISALESHAALLSGLGALLKGAVLPALVGPSLCYPSNLYRVERFVANCKLSRQKFVFSKIFSCRIVLGCFSLLKVHSPGTVQ